MVSHCARPTRGVRDRALREHRGPSSLPSHAPSKLVCSLFREWDELISHCACPLHPYFL